MSAYLDLIDIDCIKKGILNEECTSVGGLIYDDDNCTYTKEKCTKTLPLSENEPYTEFKDGKCYLASPGMKEVCKDLKDKVLGGAKNSVNYNEETGMCDISQEYCRTKGVQWLYNSNIGEYDCGTTTTQKVFEVIFGDTITRAFNRFYMPMVNAAIDATKLLIDPPTKLVPQVGLVKKTGHVYGNQCLAASSNSIPTTVITKECNPKDRNQLFLYSGDYNNGRIVYMGHQTDSRERYCLEIPCGRTPGKPEGYGTHLDKALGINYCNYYAPNQAFSWNPDNKITKSLYSSDQVLDYRRNNQRPTMMKEESYRLSDQQFEFSRHEVPDIEAEIRLLTGVLLSPIKLMIDFASLF